MKLHRIAAILLRQYYIYRGSPARILPLFVWAAVDIVLWGFITRYLGSADLPGGRMIPSLLGAVLLWDFLQRVMHSVVMTFFEDVWSHNFLNIFATPLTVIEYIAGLSLSGIVASQVSLVVMLGIGVLWFDLPLAAYGATGFACLAILLLFGVALGIIGAALVLRYGPGVEWMVWPIPAMLSPFACVFYPLATLPVWMQGVAHLLPPMYVFEGLRGLLAGSGSANGLLLIATALALAYVFLAGWLFVYVYQYALRTGLIARYSAESID